MENYSLTNNEGLENYFNNLSQTNPILFNFLINENSVIDTNIISAFKLACENYKLNVFQPPSLVDMQVELTVGLEKEKVSFSLSSINGKIDDLWESYTFSNNSFPIQSGNNVPKTQIEKATKSEQPINVASNNENKSDKSLVFLFGFAFLWILGATGVLGIIRYLINPEIPTWLIYTILFVGFIIVWKVYFEKE